MQICKSEGVDVTVPQLKHVIDICLGDIRRTVMLLQFWHQGKQQSTGLILCQENILIIFFMVMCVLAHFFTFLKPFSDVKLTMLLK
jgi:DNA polymerase III delta prime subunit